MFALTMMLCLNREEAAVAVAVVEGQKEAQRGAAVKAAEVEVEAAAAAAAAVAASLAPREADIIVQVKPIPAREVRGVLDLM